MYTSNSVTAGSDGNWMVLAFYFAPTKSICSSQEWPPVLAPWEWEQTGGVKIVQNNTEDINSQAMPR